MKFTKEKIDNVNEFTHPAVIVNQARADHRLDVYSLALSILYVLYLGKDIETRGSDHPNILNYNFSKN